MSKERTKCEVYSRVVGYLRPVQQWNPGKQEEWKDILDTWTDDPQGAANHMVLGMDLQQRREARGKVGKKTVPTWI